MMNGVHGVHGVHRVHKFHRVLLVLAALAVPAAAAAQTEERWDAGASIGIMWGPGTQPPGALYSNYDPRFAYNFDVGRFWTTHVKTDVSVALRQSDEDYDYAPFAITGVTGAYSLTNRTHAFTGVSASGTYQFFENEMMHPYVSAGVQIARQEEHRYRDEQRQTLNRITFTIPGVDTRANRVTARPFVAVGSKSYFNQRTFIRSEFMTAVDAHGFSNATLRIGFGVDF